MDFALLAWQIWDGFKIEIFYPILGIRATSPGSDQCLSRWLVTNKAHCLGDTVLQVRHIHQLRQMNNSSTRPSFDAGFRAVSD